MGVAAGVGDDVGDDEGDAVGEAVGRELGSDDGATEGAVDGAADIAGEGVADGVGEGRPDCVVVGRIGAMAPVVFAWHAAAAAKAAKAAKAKKPRRMRSNVIIDPLRDGHSEPSERTPLEPKGPPTPCLLGETLNVGPPRRQPKFSFASGGRRSLLSSRLLIDGHSGAMMLYAALSRSKPLIARARWRRSVPS